MSTEFKFKVDVLFSSHMIGRLHTALVEDPNHCSGKHFAGCLSTISSSTFFMLFQAIGRAGELFRTGWWAGFWWWAGEQQAPTWLEVWVCLSWLPAGR